MEGGNDLKKFLLFLTLMLLVIMTGCGEVKEEGTLYTKDNIFIDCIKIGYPEAFTSKIIIIEDDKALENAISEFPKLSSMPRFEEIVENYPIDEYSYVIEFIETGYESETITCDGIIINKENAAIRFKTTRQKEKNDTFGVMAGYISYAVFPKEELLGCDFSKQSYVLYPGK